MRSFVLYIIIFFQLSIFGAYGQSTNEKSSIDSVKVWIDYSKNKNLERDIKLKYLEKAYNYADRQKDASLKNKYLLNISLAYKKLQDSLNFRRVNKESIEMSARLKDSSSLAANYWDLGKFYSENGIKDSAYFKYFEAQKIYQDIGKEFFSARMLINMAIMQSDIKDYTGSDITTTKAIEILKPLKKYRHLYRCYNNLGINFNNLGEYESALFYHNQALEYQKNIKGENSYKENTLNNIGVSYEMQGNYEKAIQNYSFALKKKDLKKTNVKLYAQIIDNLAYSRFKLNESGNLELQFLESLEIRDSIKDYLGIAINKLHLSEFYLQEKDTITSLKYAYEAKQLALSTKNYRELLKALQLLSKIDKNNAENYYGSYIKLNDSLIKQERSLRDKFARIRFETDELLDKSQSLSRQNRNMLIVFSSALLLFLLLFIIRNQYIKNKVLAFEQQQQKSNEEIYNLMISQQNKLEEGSRLEKKRISQELHDGALGKLFGIRLILNTLNKKNDEATVAKRDNYLKELQLVEEELRNISHELHHYSQISNKGYINMIETLLEAQSDITNFKYEINSDSDINWEELSGSLKMNFYRIIQEALHNINKYAKATSVMINFKLDKDSVLLDVIDDGVGFNKEKVKFGIGLKNIKSRVEKLKGSLIIDSKRNKGTSINIDVPLL